MGDLRASLEGYGGRFGGGGGGGGSAAGKKNPRDLWTWRLSTPPGPPPPRLTTGSDTKADGCMSDCVRAPKNVLLPFVECKDCSGVRVCSYGCLNFYIL